MRIHYVELENFKIFDRKIHIELAHPAVIIGPNNSGKTSVIQALALWNNCIKTWFEKKHDSKEKNPSRIGINRLSIFEVPVAATSFLWSGTRTIDSERIQMSIAVGIEHGGKIKNCKLIFSYQNSEVLYFKPDAEFLNDEALMKYAADIHFNLLYPMSGIMANISQETEETPLLDGRINLFLGQGQTAQVLRNICFKVLEQDEKNKTNDWNKITETMRLLFLIDLNKPVLNEIRGSLVLTYRQPGVKAELDISLAGRGLQQMLLILAYLYWHKNSVLMIDEPDAHLEILRQKQVYAILNSVIHENSGQAIIVTHSEAILDDALDTNLTLLLQGTARNLAKDQDIRNALRNFGTEHYYKAKVHPRILYVEGRTDIDILLALAKKLNNEKAIRVFRTELNVYYTKNIEPENTLENQLIRMGGAFGNYNQHFHTLKQFVPELKGIAIFDSDNKQIEDRFDNDFALLYWKEYEIENYFITPAVLLEYAKYFFNYEDNTLFYENNIEDFIDCINATLLEMVFFGDQEQLFEYNKTSAALQRTVLRTKKMSDFAEKVFEKYSNKHNIPLLLTKSNFFNLVEFCDIEMIPIEVNEKLNKLVQFLEYTTNEQF
jgi:AAA15 family ATPase/GTPase